MRCPIRSTLPAFLVVVAMVLLGPVPSASAAAPVVTSTSADRAFDPEMEGSQTLTFSVDQPVNIVGTIIDEAGDLVRTVVDGASIANYGSLSWDGRDDGGALVDDGEYRWQVLATNTADETGTGGGIVAVDTRPVAEISAPAPDDRISGTARFVIEPSAGRLLDGVSLSLWNCRSWGCSASAIQQLDGSWIAELDSTLFRDGPAGVGGWVSYRDAYGSQHTRMLEAVGYEVVNPLTIAPPADAYFVPGNGQSRWAAWFGWSHVPASATLSISTADGEMIRGSLPWSSPQYYGGEAYWDGRDDDGVLQPPGNYRWKLVATGMSGETVEEHGSVGIAPPHAIAISAPAEGATLGDEVTVSVDVVEGDPADVTSVSVWLSNSCVDGCSGVATRSGGPDSPWTVTLRPKYADRGYGDSVRVEAAAYWSDPAGGTWTEYSAVGARWDPPDPEPTPLGIGWSSRPERAFSPNADGFEDELHTSFSTNRDTSAEFTVKDEDGVEVYRRTWSSATSFNDVWNGRDAAGDALPDGRYTYRLTAGGPDEAVTETGTTIIDTRDPFQITSPESDEVVGDVANVTVAPTHSDVELREVQVIWDGCVPWWWNGCERTVAGALDGVRTITADFNTTQITGRDARLEVSVTWRDPLGGEHLRRVGHNTEVNGTSALTDVTRSAYATPDGDGVDDGASVWFSVSRAGPVTLEVLNDTGAIVRTHDAVHFSRGPGALSWDGNDDAGATVPAGDYRFRLKLAPASGTSSTATSEPLSIEFPEHGSFDAPQPGDTLSGVERVAFRPPASLPTPDLVVVRVNHQEVARIFAPLSNGAWTTVIGTAGWDGDRELSAEFGYTDSAGRPRTSRSSTRVTIDNAGPPFTLAADPAKGLAPHTTTLTATLGKPAAGWTYRVRYGDGTPAVNGSIPDGATSLALPVHTYQRSGSYRASVEINDGSHQTQRSLAISAVRPPNRAPTATWTLDPVAGAAPHAVHAAFTAADPDEDAQLTARVDWGDGQRDTVAATSPESLGRALDHTYARAGSFLARLEVSDGRLSAVLRQRVTVVLPEPLLAHAGDDQAATAGAAVMLDAGGSRPAALIDEYRWDFGDGAQATGPHATHAYTAAGTYLATLTVRSGTASATDTATIVVSPAPVDPGGGGGTGGGTGGGGSTGGGAARGVSVQVDDGAGAALSGATVTYIGGAGTRVSATTDGSGKAVLDPIPDGKQTLYAYAPGHRPDSAAVDVTGGRGSATFNLPEGDVVEAETSSRELSLKEIIDEGIDINDPANQFSTGFTIALNFEPEEEEPPVVLSAIATGDGRLLPTGGGGGGGGPGGGPGGGEGVGCTANTCSFGDGVTVTLGGEPGKQYLVWMIIPGRFWQLKQFFEVKTVIQNLAPAPFSLEQGAASITLPAGLSLAPTAAAQSVTRSMPDIPGGASRPVTWIVRGDAAGGYKPTIDYSGTLEPVGATVSTRSILKEPIVVEGAGRLKVVVKAANRAFQGSPYRLHVGIRNMGKSTVNNAGLELLEGGQGFIYEPRMVKGGSVTELAPGATFWADEYTLVPELDSLDELNLKKSFIATEAGDRSDPGDISILSSTSTTQGAPIVGSDGARGLRLKFAPTVPDSAHGEQVLGYEIYATPDLQTPFEDEPIPATFDDAGGFVTATIKPNASPVTSHWFAVSTRVRRTGLDGVTRERHVLRHTLAQYAPAEPTDPKVEIENASDFSSCKSDRELRPRTLELKITDKFAPITSVTVQVGPFTKQVFTAPGDKTEWTLEVDVEGKILDGGVTLRAAATDRDGVVGPELITPLCNGVSPPPVSPSPGEKNPSDSGDAQTDGGSTPGGSSGDSTTNPGSTTGNQAASSADGTPAPAAKPGCKLASATVFDIEIKASCIEKAGDTYRVPLDVGGDRLRIAGLDFLAVKGSTTVELDLGDGSIRSTEPVAIKIGSVPIYEKKLTGEFDLKKKIGGASRLRVVRSATATLHGLPLTAPTLDVDLKGGEVTIETTVGFKVPMSKSPITGLTTLKASMDRGLDIENVQIVGEGFTLGGRLTIGHFSLRGGRVPPAPGGTRDRVAFTGSATVLMPFGSGNAAVQLTGRLRVVDKALDQVDVAAGAESLNKPLGTTGIFLQKIGVNVGVRDAGATLFIGGELGATLGPQVFGKSAVRVEGGLTYFINAGASDAIRVNGAISLVSAQIGAGQLTIVPADGLIDFGGKLELDAGLKVSGEVFGWVEGKRRFNVNGEATVEFPFLSVLKTTAKANLSERAVTACVEKAGVSVGASYRWGARGTLELNDGLFGGSCDVARYRSVPDSVAFVGAKARRARQATPATAITVSEGQRVAAVALSGSTGAPRVRITGPGGIELVTAAEGVATDRVLAAEDPQRRVTSIALTGAIAGTWTFTPEPGSSAIASVDRADALPAPKVRAKVVRRAGRYALRWEARRAAGQQITFTVSATNGTKSLITTTGGTGTTTFVPLSAGGRQRIAAVVTQDGRPRTTLQLGSFSARRPGSLAAPKGLTVRRHGSRLRVRWQRVAGAASYTADITLSDGRHVLVPTRASARQVELRDVARNATGTVRVRATSTGGRAGRVATAKVRSSGR